MYVGKYSIRPMDPMGYTYTSLVGKLCIPSFQGTMFLRGVLSGDPLLNLKKCNVCKYTDMLRTYQLDHVPNEWLPLGYDKL